MPKILLGSITEVAPRSSKTFMVGSKKILVVNTNGQLKAYENVCPHMGGIMRYAGDKIRCTWHGAQFNAQTGDAEFGITEGTKLTPLTIFVEGDKIYYEPIEVKSPWADDFS